MRSDLEIAQDASLRPIEDIAAESGILREELELHGDYEAKVSLDIPKSCIKWLDLASVRWKHRTGAPHALKSAVVTEMLRAEMAKEATDA